MESFFADAVAQIKKLMMEQIVMANKKMGHGKHVNVSERRDTLENDF